MRLLHLRAWEHLLSLAPMHAIVAVIRQELAIRIDAAGDLTLVDHLCGRRFGALVIAHFQARRGERRFDAVVRNLALEEGPPELEPAFGNRVAAIVGAAVQDANVNCTIEMVAIAFHVDGDLLVDTGEGDRSHCLGARDGPAIAPDRRARLDLHLHVRDLRRGRDRLHDSRKANLQFEDSVVRAPGQKREGRERESGE